MRIVMLGISLGGVLFIKAFSFLMGVFLWAWPVAASYNPQYAQPVDLGNSACLQACAEPQVQSAVGVQ